DGTPDGSGRQGAAGLDSCSSSRPLRRNPGPRREWRCGRPLLAEVVAYARPERSVGDAAERPACRPDASRRLPCRRSSVTTNPEPRANHSGFGPFTIELTGESHAQDYHAQVGSEAY